MTFKKNKIRIVTCLLTLFVFILGTVPAFAGDIYGGIPTVTLRLSNLDSSGNLIYVGIDFGVFADKNNNGNYTCVKAQRFLTQSTNITINLGTGYNENWNYKCAYRTLYVAAGQSQDEIIIASYNNGKEGWIALNNSAFSPAYVAGSVAHTAKWEQNRNKYNNVKFGKTENVTVTYSNYISKANPRLHYANVYWTGEKFMLTANLVGTIQSVKAELYAHNGSSWTKTRYSANLTTTGAKDGNATVYKGTLYNKDFITKYGGKTPHRLKIVFTGSFSGGNTKTDEVEVIIDNSTPWSTAHLKK